MQYSNFFIALSLLSSTVIIGQTSYVNYPIQLNSNPELEAFIRRSPAGLAFQEQIDDEYYYILPENGLSIQDIKITNVFYVFKENRQLSRVILTGVDSQKDEMRRHLISSFGPSQKELVDTGFWKTDWQLAQKVITLYENIHGDFSIHIEPR